MVVYQTFCLTKKTIILLHLNWLFFIAWEELETNEKCLCTCPILLLIMFIVTITSNISNLHKVRAKFEHNDYLLVMITLLCIMHQLSQFCLIID